MRKMSESGKLLCLFPGDQLVEEEGTIENLVTTLRDQIKYVYVFIIAFKQTDNRMTISLRSTISVLREDVRKTVLEQRHPGGHTLEPWQGG